MKCTITILLTLCASFTSLAFAREKCPPIPPGGVQNKNCETSTAQNPSKCINKSVQIFAKAEKFQEIKNFFMLFSNLPYEVTEIKKQENKSVIVVSYWGDGPNSLVLAEKVRSSLESKLAAFGIEKIEAAFDPKTNCK